MVPQCEVLRLTADRELLQAPQICVERLRIRGLPNRSPPAKQSLPSVKESVGTEFRLCPLCTDGRKRNAFY